MMDTEIPGRIIVTELVASATNVLLSIATIVESANIRRDSKFACMFSVIIERQDGLND